MIVRIKVGEFTMQAQNQNCEAHNTSTGSLGCKQRLSQQTMHLQNMRELLYTKSSHLDSLSSTKKLKQVILQVIQIRNSVAFTRWQKK